MLGGEAHSVTSSGLCPLPASPLHLELSSILTATDAIHVRHVASISVRGLLSMKLAYYFLLMNKGVRGMTLWTPTDLIHNMEWYDSCIGS